MTLTTFKGAEVEVRRHFSKMHFCGGVVPIEDHLGLVITGIGTTDICWLHHMTYRLLGLGIESSIIAIVAIIEDSMAWGMSLARSS